MNIPTLLVALAQVMARMKLNLNGERSLEMRTRVRLASIMYIPAVIITLNALLVFLMVRGFFLHLHHVFRIFLYSSIVILIADAIIIANFFRLLIKTRRKIRYEYNIPVGNSCEDGLLSVFCAPCVMTQMAQHTSDYATYVGHCCSDTGLSEHIELKFPNEINPREELV